MLYSDAKELYNAMVFSLSDEETKSVESYENQIQAIVSMESLIDNDTRIALEGAIDSVKKVIEKIKEAFHKLVIKFGLFIRNIQHRAQADSLKKSMTEIGNSPIAIPYATAAALDEAYKAAGIQNGFDYLNNMPGLPKGTVGILSQTLRASLKSLLTKATEVDNSLEAYLRNPDPSIDTKALRKNAGSCTKAINMTVSILGNIADTSREMRYAKTAVNNFADFIRKKKEKKEGSKGD